MDQRPRSGRRVSRRAARLHRRRQRYGRFLWFTAIGTIIPGAGLLAAGRRSGKLVMWVAVLAAVVALAVAWRTGLRSLVSSVSDPAVLGTFAMGIALVAVVWLTVAFASHRALEPDNLPAGKRLVGSVVLMTASSLVVAPLALGARYAWTARDTIDMVSRETDTATQVEDTADPWRDLPRVTVLLMGSDAGPGRDGTRPDTLIAASIDTDTGDTVMFSLPRQLPNVPFPDGSVLDAWYPTGFAGVDGGDPNNLDNHINAIYRHVPDEALAEAYPTSDDPRADAVKDAVSAVLGIPIDYYVLADLNGFERLVDAMGGVTIDVPYPIPIGTKSTDTTASGCTEPRDWIMPGDDQLLAGSEALWFGRARCAPDHPDFDYAAIGGNPVKDNHNRMERQRCMMGAIARSADPFTLLGNFESLAGAARRSVATDVPPSLWSAFAELGLKVKDAGISSIVFNDAGLAEAGAGTTGDPDFDAIAAAVDEALAPPETSAPTQEAAGTPAATEPAESSADEDQAGDESAVEDDTASEDEPSDEDAGQSTEPDAPSQDAGEETPAPASTC